VTDQPVRIRTLDQADADLRQFLLDLGPMDFTAGIEFNEAVACHYHHAQLSWLVAERDQTVVGAMPVVSRQRRGLVQLESSIEGTVAGPLLSPALPTDQAHQVFSQLLNALADALGGRSVLAAVTLSSPALLELVDGFISSRWQRQLFESGVVDCSQGLEHVDRELWTRNRRNERNRGLKRGLTLHTETDPTVLADWYPIYREDAARWAMATVPLALFEDLIQRSPGQVVLNIARLEGEVVGGHFGFVCRDRLFTWQSGARADLLRTLFLTTVLYWQDICFACERGLSAVDFGGSVGRDGLWDFKRRCGAQPEARCQLLARSPLGQGVQTLAGLIKR